MMLTQNRLVSLLRYDADDGQFYWIAPAGRHGRIAAGSIAGHIDKNGYRVIVIDGANQSAHRLVWLYFFGAFPTQQIDHANRIKSDNRFCNLREATREQNCGNVGLRVDNSTGYRGVTFNISKAKYQARLHRKSLGYFDTAEQAGIAARSYRVEKYGEFAA